MKDHDCAAPGCPVAVPGYLLACRKHWILLPLPQMEINRAWVRRRKDPHSDDATGRHLELVGEAMQVWMAIE